MNDERHISHCASDCIAAIATPPGRGALGIVRLSGADALVVADRVFRPRRGAALAARRAWTVVLGSIVDEMDIVDEALATVFHAPQSYTTEEMVELSCHGGQAVLARVLDAVLRQGARLAQPGEFTRRAFLNGRIDLTQAEAVLHLIDAPTDRARRAALRQLDGALKLRLQHIHQSLRTLRVQLEAAIEFADDVGDVFADRAALAARLATHVDELRILARGAETGRRLHDGVRVALAGRPNAGKSSLFNWLAREERALVTPIPGTTRDTIEVDIACDGVPVRVIDTAGMRRARGAIEQQGIRRARHMLADSDYVLWLCDLTRRPARDDVAFARACLGATPAVWVWTKADLAAPWPASARAPIAAAWRTITISVKTGAGMPACESVLAELVRAQCGSQDDHVIMVNARQRDLLARALEALERAYAGATTAALAELLVEDVRAAQDAIGEMTGAVTSEEVLDALFAQFCIGK